MANAAVVVDFGGTSYVSGNSNFTRGWSGDSTLGTVGYNNSSALGTYPGGTSGKFYGAAYSSPWAQSGNANIVNTTGGDILQFDNGGSTNTTTQFAALYYWQKADFINGGNSQILNIDSSTVMSFSIADSQKFSDFTAHLVFRSNGGSYYISKQSVVTPDDASYVTFDSTGDNLTADYQWIAYDPTTSIYVDVGTGTAVTPDFTDIDAFGVYAYSPTYGGRIQARLSDFTVTAVPEPSTAALMLGFGALGFILWRRRRD